MNDLPRENQSAADDVCSKKTPTETSQAHPAKPAEKPEGSAVADHDKIEAAANKSATRRPRYWLSASDRLFVGVLAGAAVLLMLVHWVRLSGWGTEPVEIDRHSLREYKYRIDINSVGWIEFAQLEGIGRTRAEQIVADRKQNGPFRSLDDLERVRGIGPKTLAKLKPWLAIRHPDPIARAPGE